MPKNLSGSSLPSQKIDCINRTLAFEQNESKKTEGFIYSRPRLNDKNSTLNQLVNYLNFIGFNFKLNLIPIDIISDFIQTKAEDGNSNKTLLEHISKISSTFTALDNLNYAINVTTEDFTQLRTEFRNVGEKSRHKNRAFKLPKKVVSDLYKLNHVSGIIAELQDACGYRIHEALQVTPQIIEVRNDGFYIKEGAIKGKGGFPLHEKKISAQLVQKITQDFTSLGEWGITPAQYNSDIKQVAGVKHSSHAFRYNFAQALYAKLIREGHKKGLAKLIVSEAMGHHRPEITNHYLKV